MSQFYYRQFYRRHLPHIQPPEATLFVTFRLDGSIPKPVLEHWRIEKKRMEAEQLRLAAIAPPGAAPNRDDRDEEQLRFQRRWFRRFEDLLHQETIGPVWLKHAQIAAIVAEALRFRDGRVYRLEAYCIMPNHVHVVFAPLLTEALARELAVKANAGRMRRQTGGVPPKTQTNSLRNRDTRTDGLGHGKNSPVLAYIMHSPKGNTSRKCNLALGRRGAFWEHESFDHVIRSEEGRDRIVKYVLNNPVKAGLVKNWQDWKWSYRRPSSPK